MDLLTRRYRTAKSIAGPLLFIERAEHVSIGEMVRIIVSEKDERSGQVIEVSDQYAVIQVLEETTGIGVHDTDIYFTGSVAKVDLSLDMLGRKFNGTGHPTDGLPPVIPHKRYKITGYPINPVDRGVPSDFIQTGISSIDGLNTLVRGQKLPIFSGSGLPAMEIVAQILRNAKVVGEEEGFAIVFAGMGITSREASYRTREDHRELADQLYAFYAQGRDIRRIASIVGEEGLSESDRAHLKFATEFEMEYIKQGQISRDIINTLDLGWKLMQHFPEDRFTRVRPEIMGRYYVRSG